MRRGKAQPCVVCREPVKANTYRVDVRIVMGFRELVWRGRLCSRCAAVADGDPAFVVQGLMETGPDKIERNSDGCGDE